MYLDSAIIVKLVTHEVDSFFYVAQLQGKANIWSSVLSLTECYSALCRKEREGFLNKNQRTGAWKLIDGFFQEASIQAVDISPSILREANRILELCVKTIPLRSLDAIHLASCQQSASWPLFANDRRMRDAAKLLGIELAPLP